MERNLIITGGQIWTGCKEAIFAESALVKNDRFIATGSFEQMKTLSQGQETIVLDTDGGLIIPGISDAHAHLTAYCKQNLYLDLSQTKSFDELCSLVKEYASKVPADMWIRGINYNDSNWKEAISFTRNDLDKINLNSPILISRYCGHVHVANTKALKTSFLFNDLSDNKDIARDREKIPTGVLYDGAVSPIIKIIEEIYENPSEVSQMILDGCKKFASFGITSVHACDAASFGLGEDFMTLQKLNKKGLLPLRVSMWLDSLPNFEISSGFGDTMLQYGGLKLFLDGNLGGRTAAMRECFTDDPGNIGQLIYSDEHLEEILHTAFTKHIQVQIHVIGDRATDQAIRVIDKIVSSNKSTPHLPIRLNHVIVCPYDQIEKLKKIPVTIDVQPIQAYTDRAMAPQRLGTERMRGAYSYKSMYDSGILMTGSSDAPMENPNPWLGIWAAVCRCNDFGQPLKDFPESEKLSLHEALTLYTTMPPTVIGAGNHLGRIAPGYLADFAVLETNPFYEKDMAESLKNVKTKLTFCNGRLTFGKLDGWEIFGK